MRRVTPTLLLFGAVAIAGLLAGCNERLDDPTTSEGILSIEKVDPVIVEADVTPNDPNGNPQTLADDEVTVTLKNRPRTANVGPWSDVFINKAVRGCTGLGAPAGTTLYLASFTIPSGGSVTVSAIAVTQVEKLAQAPGDTWLCSMVFEGKDLAGNPVSSEPASFGISFVNG